MLLPAFLRSPANSSSRLVNCHFDSTPRLLPSKQILKIGRPRKFYNIWGKLLVKTVFREPVDPRAITQPDWLLSSGFMFASY